MKLFMNMFLLLFLFAGCTTTSDNSETKVDSNEATNISGEIKVYTRDTSSGTRANFMSTIGFEEAQADDSVLVDGFITQGNYEISAAVQQDENAIGYISLSSYDSNLLKGLNYEGIEPTIDNVLNGSYKLARNFNYMLRDDYSMFANGVQIEQIAVAFTEYIKTLEGKTNIATEGGIVNLQQGTSWKDIKSNHPICSEDNSQIVIKFGGSDSVEKIATGLSPDFSSKCGNFGVEHNHTGSSNAWKGLNGGNSDPNDGLSIHIGFASREFKASEQAETTGVVSGDAIVVVVNKKSSFNNITQENLKNIYSGEITDWATLAKSS